MTPAERKAKTQPKDQGHYTDTGVRCSFCDEPARFKWIWIWITGWTYGCPEHYVMRA